MKRPRRSLARQPVSIREWESLSIADFGDKRDFYELHEWALGEEGKKILEAGVGKISARNQVGVLMTKTGCVLEILPKTEDGIEVEASRKLLLSMLYRSGRLPILVGRSSPTEVSRLPLTESLVELFLDAVMFLAKRGLASSYQTHKETLPCVRGRIDFQGFIRRGMCSDRVPCTFDNLSSNSPENRILATTLLICYNAGIGSSNLQRMGFLNDAFQEIEPLSSARLALDVLRGVSIDRKNHAYSDALELARLILTGLNVAGTWASPILFSIFFPMEKVFERYVLAELLDMKGRGELRSVRYQSNPYSLLLKLSEGKLISSFNLKPDLVVITARNERLLVDAKWKLLDEDAIDGKNGISQSDLYQMLSYATIYRGESAIVDRLMLVYPKWSRFTSFMKYSYADGARTPLFIIPAPLEGDGAWSLMV